MDERTFEAGRSQLVAHDHAVCAYASDKELEAALAAFLEGGLARRELMVLIHAFPDEEDAWALLERARPGAARLRSDELVVVSLYRDAFEGSGSRIDYAHAQRVIESLLARARGVGRAGVRIFADASRVYLAADRAREWFDFENWLGRRLHHVVSLVCAYPRGDALRPEIFPQLLRTHAYRFEPTR